MLPRCWKSKASRITIQRLVLLPCLIVLSLLAAGGQPMKDAQIRELRYVRVALKTVAALINRLQARGGTHVLSRIRQLP